MTTEKRLIIIFGIIGIVFGLLFCALGVWIFSFETATDTNSYTLLGITLTGKQLAALLVWIGFVIIFYSIRKMITHSRQNTTN
jgi:uncharacterized membrane protein